MSLNFVSSLYNILKSIGFGAIFFCRTRAYTTNTIIQENHIAPDNIAFCDAIVTLGSCSAESFENPASPFIARWDIFLCACPYFFPNCQNVCLHFHLIGSIRHINTSIHGGPPGFSHPGAPIHAIRWPVLRILMPFNIMYAACRNQQSILLFFI